MSQHIFQPPGEGESNVLRTNIGIKRSGSAVQINLQCGADYQAMEVYDRLIEAAQKGELRIDLKSR